MSFLDTTMSSTYILISVLISKVTFADKGKQSRTPLLCFVARFSWSGTLKLSGALRCKATGCAILQDVHCDGHSAANILSVSDPLATHPAEALLIIHQSAHSFLKLSMVISRRPFASTLSATTPSGLRRTSPRRTRQW